MIASWVDAAKADPEYGGEKLKENLLTAQRAFSLPRGAEISKILFKSGLGNHPAVIGFMTEVGKLLEGDNMTHGKGTNTANVAPVLYGMTNHKEYLDAYDCTNKPNISRRCP